MNHITHIEFAGKDGEQLERFYRELFGWNIARRQDSPFPYGDIETTSVPTAGIRHEPEGCGEIVIYVDVADVADTVQRAEALGATVRLPPMDGGAVVFALIVDPEGNPLGLTQQKPT